MREQAREDHNLPHRCFIHRPQHRGAFAEQHVDLAVDQLLQSRPVIGDLDGLGVDLEESSFLASQLSAVVPETTAKVVFSMSFAAGEPRQTGRSGGALASASRNAAAESARTDSTDAASEDRDRERNLLPAAQRGAGRYAQQVDAAGLNLAQAVIGRDLHPVDHEVRALQVRPDLLGDLLAERHRRSLRPPPDLPR